MQENLSGSLDVISGSFSCIDDFIDEDISMLMQSKQFEDDLINSFTINMYSINNNAPKPLWTYCAISHQIVKVWPNTEVVVLDEERVKILKKEDKIECLAGQNLIRLPKKYVDMGEWN